MHTVAMQTPTCLYLNYIGHKSFAFMLDIFWFPHILLYLQLFPVISIVLHRRKSLVSPRLPWYVLGLSKHLLALLLSSQSYILNTTTEGEKPCYPSLMLCSEEHPMPLCPPIFPLVGWCYIPFWYDTFDTLWCSLL